MNRTWIRKSLAALLTLAMVIAVCGAFAKPAKALTNPQINVPGGERNVSPGQSVNMNASYDNSSGDISYAWSCSGGTFNGSSATSANSSNVYWVAPSTPGQYFVYLTISDNNGPQQTSREFIVKASSVTISSNVTGSLKKNSSRNLTATAFPTNANITWSVDNSSQASVYPTTGPSTTVTALADSNYVNVYATLDNGTRSDPYAIQLAPADQTVPVITGVPSSIVMGVNSNETVTATVSPSNVKDADIHWTLTLTGGTISSGTGRSTTITSGAAGTGSLTVQVWDNATEGYTHSETKTIPITVSATNGWVNASPASSTSLTSGQTLQFGITASDDGVYAESDNPSVVRVITSSPLAATSGLIQVQAQNVNSGTANITFRSAKFSAKTSIQVTVNGGGGSTSWNLYPTSVFSMYTNTTLNSYMYVSNYGGNTISAWSSAPTYVNVTNINQSTGAITLTSYGNVYSGAVIYVSVNGTTKSVPVNVISGSAEMDAWMEPSFNYSDTMGKGDSAILVVRVQNPYANNLKVTVTRDNIRSYLKQYSNYAYSKSGNVYTSTLQQGSDGYYYARFYVYPQYNGNTTLTVKYNSQTDVHHAYLGFKVTGYPTMPQTGPDYTGVYIVTGLCILTLGAAVVLQVKKKKQQQEG